MSKTRAFILISLALLCGVGIGAVAVILGANRIERLNRVNEQLVAIAPSAAVSAELATLRHLRSGDTNAAIADLEWALASDLWQLERSINEQRRGVDPQFIRARDAAREYLQTHPAKQKSQPEKPSRNE